LAKPTTVVSFSNSLDVDGNPVWNDISSYVLSVDIGRGKSNDLDSYSSGTVSISLDNRSRAFEPNFAASPFYGLIEPFGQVKVVSAGFTQFVGVIDSWSFGYSEKGFFATAQINANDNLTLIAKNTLTGGSFASAQLSGNRVKDILYGTDVYYNDPTCIDSGTRTITTDTVVEGASVLDYLQKIGANDGALFYARRDGLLAYQDSTLANTTGLATTRKNLCINSSLEVAVTANWAGGVRSASWGYFGTYSYASSNFDSGIRYTETDSLKYLRDTTYNISFYIKNNTAATKTLDVSAYMTSAGIVNDDSNLTTTLTLSANEIKRVNLGTIKSSKSTDGIYLSLSQYPLTTANTYFIDGLLIEKSLKLNQYFDGSSTISAPSGQSYVFSFEGASHYSTSVWQTTVNTLIDYSVVTSITDSNYSGIKFNDVSMAYASEKLYNQISISGNSLTSTASDLVSQSKYGLKEYSVTDAILNTQSDNDSLANFLLSLYHLPDYRAESINLTLHNLSTTDQNTILAMDMLSQINLKFRPGNSGAALSANYQVIGINQSISPEEHSVELRVTSLDNFGFVLDHPALGILDTNRLV
jgi:hypothetical protein